jgi:hypothetical protein
MIQRLMTVVYDSYIGATSRHRTEYLNLDIVRKHFGKDAQTIFKNGRVQKVFVTTELDGKRILLVYAERDDV